MTDEKLTDEERADLCDGRLSIDAEVKAVRIIDAHAAERAALTEQVAQLTRERDEARAECEDQQLKSEVARLTEALAAAEQHVSVLQKALGEFNPDGEGPSMSALDLHYKARAEAAERDRDAARALLRQWRGHDGD